jgi:predicted pyridoxine 5'-phosphate oxidase superfamily flavin-nucleotide-binding protein
MSKTRYTPKQQVEIKSGQLKRAEENLAVATSRVEKAKTARAKAQTAVVRIKKALEAAVLRAEETNRKKDDAKVRVKIVKIEAFSGAGKPVAGRIEKKVEDTLFVTFVNRRGPVLEFRKGEDGVWATGLVGTAVYRLEKIDA